MITVTTIVRFLLFNGDAIRKLAGSKTATWVGLLFVISAGFAREYDGEYLVAQPWHLLIPVAASTLGCFLLVLFVHGLAWFRNVRDVSFLEAFRALLNLYWMTAPLAWIYAVPVERLFDPGGATRANLILLGIVALWRVALMVRCVQVIYKAHPVAALIPVMLFSDILSMAALWLVPGPVFMIMGGVRLTESESIILGVRVWLVLLGYGTLLFWLVGYLVLCFRSGDWRYFKSQPDVNGGSSAVSWGVWSLVALSLLIWIPILPFTQSEQSLRWKSERLIRGEDFEGFSKLTQEHPQSDFPPHWDPPPRLGYGESDPDVFKALSGLIAGEAADWVVVLYRDKMEWSAISRRWMGDGLDAYSDDELASFVETISEFENGAEIAAAYDITIEEMLSAEDLELTDVRRALLQRLLELGETAEALD